MKPGHNHQGTEGDGHSHPAGSHNHAPGTFGTAFTIGTALNGGFVVAQLFYGFIAQSTALLADAVHNSGDVLGLLMAWRAATLARRRPTATRTYGWGRSTILASFANAVILLFSCGAIAFEAVHRFETPTTVGGYTVMCVAALGIVINGVTALLFMRGRRGDLNVRSAFMHMAMDACVSIGVVVAGLLIILTGWQWLDPVTSLLIVAIVTVGTWDLLKDSANLAFDAVPKGIDLAKVRSTLCALPGVVDIHDLHVWGLSTTQTALTVHLVQADGNNPALIGLATAKVQKCFRISHATFQIETAELAESCKLRSVDVI